ncbi:single-stranded DNA-binding protein [Acinetobacter baumannii]|uniref:single-stranded DNA-binding protein n=1 Tax=Acinetobacter baumannii TaxID=470 RepID=UPI00225A8837|nr:single-stranded DNA-binding protein [Acinetobacter baumannii]MCX3034231.1 single-stranded DNA-binding protein [Acinetobacter baumannii]
MRGINKVILLGTLGKDPDRKQFADNNSSSTFTIATSERYKTDNGYEEDVQWHRIVATGPLADRCNALLRKGSKVYIEGSLRSRSWVDRKTNETKYITEIRASYFQLLEDGAATSQEGQYQGNPNNQYAQQQNRNSIQNHGQFNSRNNQNRGQTYNRNNRNSQNSWGQNQHNYQSNDPHDWQGNRFDQNRNYQNHQSNDYQNNRQANFNRTGNGQYQHNHHQNNRGSSNYDQGPDNNHYNNDYYNQGPNFRNR